jgi:hypothetical protein
MPSELWLGGVFLNEIRKWYNYWGEVSVDSDEFLDRTGKINWAKWREYHKSIWEIWVEIGSK